MGVFVKHAACSSCGSSDGLAIYDDGSSHCFVCQKTVPSEEFKEAIAGETARIKPKNKENLALNDKVKEKEAITDEKASQIKDETSTRCNGYRGLSDSITAYFGVRHSFSEEDGSVVEQYYPCTQQGKLVGYKVREVPKDFRSIGRTGVTTECFMQFRFPRGGKYVILTEGECLLPTTKVLTRKGWVSLEDYESGEVMQANGEFAEPLAKIYKDYNGEMVKYRSGSYYLDLTPEHNMVRIDKKHGLIKVKAGDSTQKHKPVPRTVKFESDPDNLMARLQVMFSADFTFREGGDIYGCLKKQRKIDRAKMLLNKAGVRYTANLDNRGYTSFFIHRGHGLNVSKEFSYERDLASASTIVEEVLFWDGNSVPDRQQIEYSSTIKANAEFVQTCAHLSGFVSTIITRKSEKYLCYKVSILYKKQTSDTQNGFIKYNYSGKVACLTMPHGTLLVKQGDSVSVTGNCDALSAYQMLKEYNEKRGNDYEVAVVSATTGAQSAKQIANNYTFFDSFEQIIISYDNDDAGQKAINSIVKVLPKGKVKIMQMRHKDANEYLQKGDSKSFIGDFYNAKTYVPDGIVASNNLGDKMREELKIPKVPLPPFMHKLQKMMAGGIPLGRIVNMGSASGTGKSTIIDECVYYWIFNSPHMVGIVSLESDSGQYGIKILSRHISSKIELLESEEALELLDREDVKQKEYELFNTEEGTPRFYLIEERDGGVESLKSLIENMIISMGCKVIILDPLQDVLDSLPGEDQAQFMAWQKGMVKSHKCSFVNVNHVRKNGTGQKANSAGADLHEEDFHGNSAIFKSGACNLLFVRDKEAEDPIERNTTRMKASKIRWTGLTGSAGSYYYDNPTHTMWDLEDWLVQNGPKDF